MKKYLLVLLGLFILTTTTYSQELTEKEKADGRFKEALDYLEEAAKISPENENVKKMLPQVKAVMK